MSKHEIEEFSQLEKKLSSHAAEMEMSIKEPADMDGSFVIRVIKSGIWLTVKPPKGTGRPVELTDVTAKLYSMRINNADIKTIDKEVRKLRVAGRLARGFRMSNMTARCRRSHHR
jgi:predicted transcriptional regulator